MRINKPLLALALPTLLFIPLFKPVAAFAQRIVVPYSGHPGAVEVYDLNGVAITNLSDVTVPFHPGTYISNPYGVATDNSGNIYVGNVNDGTNGWVAEFGPDYHLVRSNLTSLPTNFPPGDLAVDQEGFIYVSKYPNGAILRFDPNGNLVSNYTNGSFWGLDGAFNGNSGIACAGSNIYSPGYGLGAFQIYAGGQENGGLEYKFYTNFAQSRVDAVAADRYGYLYAFQASGDPGLPGIVYKFDPNGNQGGGFAVSSNAVYGVVVDYSGNVYVGVGGFGDSGVDEYDPRGAFVRNIPNTLNYGGHFAVQPPPPQFGVAMVGNQTLAFWTPAATNYVLQSVTNAGATNWLAVTNGTPIAGVGFADNLPARFFRYPVFNTKYYGGLLPFIFVTDYNYDYNVDGYAGILDFNLPNPDQGGDGDLNEPEGMAIDASDNLYVADQYTGAIWKYGPPAVTSIAAFTGFNNPFALAVDEAGNIYVTSASSFGNGSPVSKYDSSGFFIANIGYSDGALAVCKGNIYTSTNGNLAAYNSTGQLIALNTSISPAGLAVDYRGYVYAIDGSGKIHKSDLNLNPIAGYSVNDPNSAAAAFGWGGIAVDLLGNLYVLRGDDGVDEYDASGNLLDSVSGGNYGAPQFIAAQTPVLPVKFAAPGNQCAFYWTSTVPLMPAVSNYYVVHPLFSPLVSVTNLASTNWLTATDAVPGMGVIISNAPPGSVFRLQPVGQQFP